MQITEEIDGIRFTVNENGILTIGDTIEIPLIMALALRLFLERVDVWYRLQRYELSAGNLSQAA